MSEQTMNEQMKTITIVIDLEGNEILYLDGRLWHLHIDGEVSGCDIANAAAGDPVLVDLRRLQDFKGFKRFPLDWKD